MVLRDIFLTLEALLDLQYEKNANGTYRVNTVIRELVYPSLYENISFGDNEIGYYLANTEMSYQGEANIRNAFTELMRPKENSNRYPTACFCDRISIEKMYTYYKERIDKVCENHSEKMTVIRKFIEDCLSTDEEMKSKLQLICHEPQQYITWIVIFSMFNTQLSYGKYESYLKINASEYSSFHLSDTVTRHKISKHLQKSRRHLSIFTMTLVVANSLQLAYLVLPLIMPDNVLPSPLSSISSCVFLLCISVILLLARLFHMHMAKKYSHLQTYYDNFDLNEEVSNQLKNLQNYRKLEMVSFQITTHSHVERERFRLIIRIATGIALSVSLLLSFLMKSLPIMLAGTCLICFLAMYADRYFNQYHYSCHYDAINLPEGEKTNSLRGMAKIYRREYEITQFNLDHEYYYVTAHVHSTKCFQHIFRMTYNRIYNFIAVTTVILMLFNIVILCIAILSQLVPAMYTYLQVASPTFFSTFLVLFLIILSIINIIALLNTNHNYISLAQLSFASFYAKQDITYAERIFLNLQSQGKIKEVDVARGIFSHSIEYIDNGIPLETIWPESDRMLFIHRIPTLRPWLISASWLIFGFLFFLLVWHCKIYVLTIPLLILTIVADIIIEYHVLTNLKKKTFIKAIQSLD